ncbi:hypothetical protein [Pseudoblastomonas halimionae]|uniref:Uncharacterized protein n=1 Tax=Alteriqipengyuania halimionae TaxID=1926630 RepID=A0A6I4U8G6_9SPHN|nr:hypothetical protein [Alteriqipengyuania halimionae]MXP10762.1 hypothetical protein [Alteriqipengyuania halimionae]
MTIEMENKLVSEIEGIEEEKRMLIRQIALASASGKSNKTALMKMAKLTRRKRRLTRPLTSAAA